LAIRVRPSATIKTALPLTTDGLSICLPQQQKQDGQQYKSFHNGKLSSITVTGDKNIVKFATPEKLLIANS
jgi:hypothetical protein